MPVKNSFSKYLATPGINWSTLKEMGRSPLHYKFRLSHPREDSTELARGRAVHTATLEPDLFEKEYVVYPGKTRRGKKWDEFEVTYGAAYTILKQDERDKAMLCAEAIRKHPEASALLSEAEYEQSF